MPHEQMDTGLQILFYISLAAVMLIALGIQTIAHSLSGRKYNSLVQSGLWFWMDVVVDSLLFGIALCADLTNGSGPWYCSMVALTSMVHGALGDPLIREPAYFIHKNLYRYFIYENVKEGGRREI